MDTKLDTIVKHAIFNAINNLDGPQLQERATKMLDPKKDEPSPE